MTARQRRRPRRRYIVAVSFKSEGIAWPPAMMLNRMYHCVPSNMSATAAPLRPPGGPSNTSNNT